MDIFHPTNIYLYINALCSVKVNTTELCCPCSSWNDRKMLLTWRTNDILHSYKRNGILDCATEVKLWNVIYSLVEYECNWYIAQRNRSDTLCKYTSSNGLHCVTEVTLHKCNGTAILHTVIEETHHINIMELLYCKVWWKWHISLYYRGDTLQYVLITNKMHIFYNKFLLHSFLSALHFSKEYIRSSSGARHNILYYTVWYNRALRIVYLIGH
jgi:hypothetical protein